MGANGLIDVSASLRSGMVTGQTTPGPDRTDTEHRARRRLQCIGARRWSSEDFIEDFVYVSQEAARYLADRGIQAVGVDYLSVGGFRKDGVETHRVLLEAGIWVIEGLDLSEVSLASTN